MRPVVKAGLTGAGYLAAFAIALAVVAVYVAVTNGPDRQNSSGMYAFGDGLLFVAVFAVTAIPATCVALFFLRQYSPFWVLLPIVAPVLTLSGIAALMVCAAAQNADAHSVLHGWSGPALLRIFAAPVFGLAFLLAGLFAPKRVARIALLVAAGTEGAVLSLALFTWIR